MKFDFEHYLKAGHGRAYLIAKEDPGKYREAILNACRKDYTFDMQCEGSRAFLTADLVSLFDDPEPFIKTAIESFASTKIDNVADEIQYLSDLLMEFDQRRIVLRKYLDLWKTVKNTPYEELKEDYIQLRFNLEYLAIKLVNNHSWKVAEKIATDIGEWYISLGDDAESEFIWFYSRLEEQYGEEETREHLLKLSETSPEIKAFCNNDLEYSKDFGKKITRKKNKLTASEIERRFAEIDALEPEAPTQDDLDAIARANAEKPEETLTLEEYRAQREYSGRLLLRIPKELHKQLIEAAKENGVSLNQYALYKLAK